MTRKARQKVAAPGRWAESGRMIQGAMPLTIRKKPSLRMTTNGATDDA